LEKVQMLDAGLSLYPLAGWLAGWRASWLADWLAGWLTD
jgi:hypothetical protein